MSEHGRWPTLQCQLSVVLRDVSATVGKEWERAACLGYSNENRDQVDGAHTRVHQVDGGVISEF